MGMHRGHLSVTQPKMSPATVYLEPFSFVFACREHSRGWSQPWVCAGWAGGSPAKENLKIFQFFIPALDLLPLIVSERFWEGVSPAGSRILHPWQLSSSFTSIPCGAGSLDGARPPLEEDPKGSFIALHSIITSLFLSSQVLQAVSEPIFGHGSKYHLFFPLSVAVPGKRNDKGESQKTSQEKGLES